MSSKMSDQATANGDATPPSYSSKFFDKGAAAAVSRQIYLKIVFGGLMMMAIVIFGIFSIYWGALWRIPAHNLPGWVIVRVTPTVADLVLTDRRTSTVAKSAVQ